MEHTNEEYNPRGIQQLILEKRGDRTNERLSKDCGGTPKANRVQGMMRQPMRAYPDPDTIQALARGLRVPVLEVVMACTVSIGLDVTPAPAGRDLVLYGAGRLPKEAQKALVVLSDQMQEMAGG